MIDQKVLEFVKSHVFDPTIGIMHEKRARSSAFIFDLMEPERPMIDQKVLEFVKSHVSARKTRGVL